MSLKRAKTERLPSYGPEIELERLTLLAHVDDPYGRVDMKLKMRPFSAPISEIYFTRDQNQSR